MKFIETTIDKSSSMSANETAQARNSFEAKYWTIVLFVLLNAIIGIILLFYFEWKDRGMFELIRVDEIINSILFFGNIALSRSRGWGGIFFSVAIFSYYLIEYIIPFFSS